MSYLDSLAGLDSMVLHINTRSDQCSTVSTSIAMDSESFVLVPKKRRKLGRASRTPLADKTSDFNANISPSLNTGIPHPPDFSISIYRDSPDESSPSFVPSQRNHISRFPSFKPLPPVPAASPLRTSFLDFSFHSASSSPVTNSERTPPTIPSSISPQRSCAELSPERPKNFEATPQKIHDEPYLIPAFQHPNSPYVPWAPPVRRKILHPLSAESHISDLSSGYSRPFSRSGARAPEPAETPEPGIRRASPASKCWRRLRKAVFQGANRLAARLFALKRPFSIKRPVSPCSTANFHPNHVRSVSREDNFFVATYSPSPPSPMAVLSGRRVFASSTASLASSDSATLAAWLATRKQAALEERDYEPGSMMTLEEYERMGSWLDTSGDGQQEGKWLCGVPGCEIHAKDTMLHSSQVTRIDFSVPKETSTSGPYPQIHASQPTTLPPQCYSLPQFQARTRLSPARKTSVSGTPGDNAYLSGGIPEREEMENSMPGGWTF